jgi:hypothetical protein
VAFTHETQLGLQAAHLSILASKNPVTQEQLLLMFLLVSAQVSQVDEIVQVAHRAGHLLQVPFLSKNPDEQAHVLSKMFNDAPVMQDEQTVGLAGVHVEQSLV